MRRNPTESEQTRELCRKLEAAGGLTYAAIGSSWQGAGWPDRWIAFGGWSGWLEFKNRDGKLSALQRRICKNIVRVGVPCYVVRFMDNTRVSGDNEMQIESVIDDKILAHSIFTVHELIRDLCKL